MGIENHELKTDPEPFKSSMWGWKNYEIRPHDRDFKCGDTVTLRETQYSAEEMNSGKPLEYTGRALGRSIAEVRTGYGLKDGYCILGLISI